MREVIKSEIENAKEYFLKYQYQSLSEDRLFCHVLLKYIFGVEYNDHADMITDGPNDGGIDFVYYDEEEAKVVICQSKYTEKLDYNTISSELDKMASTIINFNKSNTGSYNERLKSILQNALDRLPDENSGNIEYNVFTSAEVDPNGAMKKITKTNHLFSEDAVSVFTADEIEKKIQSVREALTTIKEAKIKIDHAKNILHYNDSADSEGIMVNAKSASIISLYNKYAGKGLFDLNIRKYIRNNLVDTGIKRTLDRDRDNFWFLNNGIIIACKEFIEDGDTIKLRDFSIVNGGQTTTLIGTYKGNNKQDFLIPCKIVAPKKEGDEINFFTKIAEATNSQKPIYARDLKSNTPEMIRLGKWLQDNNVYLEIKRGVKPNKNCKFCIKNDELAQLILSFIYQRPGTARSGKRVIFENTDVYSKIFKVNYDKDTDKKSFLLDLIDLHERYKIIEINFKKGGLSEEQAEVLKNGKQIVFAILGVIYRYANNDISENDLNENPQVIKSIPFMYGKFVSNYTGNDLDDKLRRLVYDIVKIVADSYKIAYGSKQTTSVSNYFKTDSKYYNNILKGFVGYLPMTIGEDIKSNMNILKRN